MSFFISLKIAKRKENFVENMWKAIEEKETRKGLIERMIEIYEST